MYTLMDIYVVFSMMNWHNILVGALIKRTVDGGDIMAFIYPTSCAIHFHLSIQPVTSIRVFGEYVWIMILMHIYHILKQMLVIYHPW